MLAIKILLAVNAFLALVLFGPWILRRLKTAKMQQIAGIVLGLCLMAGMGFMYYDTNIRGGNGVFSGLVSALNGVFSGTVTTPNLNGDLWLGSGSGQYASLSACTAALPSSGGTCNMPAGWAETWAGNLTISKNNTSIVAHGPCAITQGSFQLVLPDTVHGVSIVGSVMWGGANNSNNCKFIYTGTGAAIVIGTSGGNTDAANKITFQNFGVDITGAGNSAIGIDTYGLGLSEFNKIIIFGGPGAGNSQIGLRMNTNVLTDGEGFLMTNSYVANTNIGIQLNSTTYKTFNEVNMSLATGAVAGYDLENVGAVRIIGGSTFLPTTAYKFVNSAGVYVTGGAEATTNSATFDSNSSNNIIVPTNPGNLHAAVNNGNNNLVVRPGGIQLNGSSGQILQCSQGATAILTGNSTDQTIYSCTIPANTVAAGKCIRVHADFTSNTAANSVTYKSFLGAANISSNSATGNLAFDFTETICNNAGVQNAQTNTLIHNVSTSNAFTSFGGSAINSTVDMTLAQTWKMTFNVANTNTVTGNLVYMELIQ